MVRYNSGSRRCRRTSLGHRQPGSGHGQKAALSSSCAAAAVATAKPSPPPEELGYDEMEFFSEICSEFYLPWKEDTTVVRQYFLLGDGRKLSGLKWGDAAPELVVLHGGKQNAHTWDTVALTLDWPLLSLDLPSHGCSDAAKDGLHDPGSLAADIAEVMDQAASSARAVCGVSLGGLTAIALAAIRPDLVRGLILVDVTPGITSKRPPMSGEFKMTDATFPSFDDLLARAAKQNPSHSRAALRRALLHNAMPRAPDHPL